MVQLLGFRSITIENTLTVKLLLNCSVGRFLCRRTFTFQANNLTFSWVYGVVIEIYNQYSFRSCHDKSCKILTPTWGVITALLFLAPLNCANLVKHDVEYHNLYCSL